MNGLYYLSYMLIMLYEPNLHDTKHMSISSDLRVSNIHSMTYARFYRNCIDTNVFYH